MADRRTEDTPLAPPRPLGRDQVRSTSGHPPISKAASSQASGRPAGASGSPVAAGSTVAGRDAGGSTGTTSAAPARKTGRTRKARLRVTHLDPWSVMKTSFLLSVAFGIVTVVAVFVVWSVLGAAGVWESINSTVSDVVGDDASSGFDIENYLGMSRVMGFTMLVAVVDVVLITVISTLVAFLYNMAASLLGGVEVILAEDS